MPRVLFVNPGLYAIGGMQAWLDALMPDLEAKGWECWLALPDGPFNDARSYLRNYPWHRVHLLDNRTGTRLGGLKAIERAFARVKPDVVLVANIVGVYDLAERQRYAGAWTPRVAMCTHSNDEGIFGDLSRYADVIDGFVAPNRLIEAAAAEVAGYPRERIAYAPYGLDVPELQAPSKGANGRLDVVFCARLEQSQKRLLDLPGIGERLAALGVDFRIEVIGDGPDEGLLREAVASSSVRERFVLRGAVPPAKLLGEELRAGRILLVTSAWENGPLVLFQAMARGMAAVSSRYVGSGREEALLDGVNCRLFEIGDLDAAAACLASLRDRDVCTHLAMAGRRMVADCYSRERSAAAWDRALREIAERPLRPVRAAPEPHVRAGRLDRLLGARMGDSVRGLMGLRAAASGPGDEWPHTRSAAGPPAAFLDRLARLDRSPRQG
ncbi:MAG TPA: glycosyltransferase [Thermoanaerobaculia bacterium]|nr:glycosyltransferase [Thermoanaerobaculia bacterium]